MLLFVVTCFTLGTLGGQPQLRNTVALQDGRVVELPGVQPYKYWNCADTSIFKNDREGNYGGEPILIVGPDAKALIRFTDLHRAIGPNKRIVEAKLTLQLTSTAEPKEVRLHRLLTDWREGYGRRRSKQGTKVPWSATWEHRLSPGQLSGEKWAAAGCSAPNKDFVDKPSGVSRRLGPDRRIQITGLHQDVQSWYERSYTNFGWVLLCDDPGVEFASSEGVAGRPMLEITYEELAREPARTVDLSVIFIERLPEFKRYDPTDAYTRKDDRGTPVGIMDRPGLAAERKWPADGSLVTYRGHVKNLAAQHSVPGFRYTWYINGKHVRTGEHTAPVGPNDTVVLEVPAIWVDNHTDHRVRTVALQVETTVPEATLNNNYLSIYSHGLNLGIWCEQSFADYIASKLNAVGSYSFEDWIQWQFWLWNEVYLAESKFSFAPDGCLERVRIQRITIVPDGTLEGGNHIPGGQTDFNFDGEWGFEWSEDDTENVKRYCDYIRTNLDGALLHECSHQIGLMDIYVMNVDASLPDGSRGKVRLKAGGPHVVTRGHIDPFGGLMGGGDTRNDISVPGFLAIRNEPVRDPRYEFRLFEPTGLYSSVDVAGLNSNLGFRRGFYGEFLYDLPKLIFVRALDGSGQPMPKAQLTFFQLNGGQFRDEPPVFEGETDDQGVFRLPNRPTSELQDFKTLTGHVLSPNPFGRIDVVGGNGVFLVRARYQNQEEWQFIKLWELVVARYRGAESVLIKDLHFNLCPRPLEARNVALGRAVTTTWAADGVNSLTDGDPKTALQVPPTRTASITIDLGSEVEVGEVTLEVYGSHGDFWQEFDIYVLQNPGPEGTLVPFASEGNWRWSIGHKRDVDPDDHELWSLAYRREPIRGRYVRIVNRSEHGGKLGEIRVRIPVPPETVE